jgi:hypothetical protein
MSHAHVVLFLSVVFTSTPASAITWHIRADGTGDAPNIQAAVNLATSGDIIELAPGTYNGTGNRDVTFGGKRLTVQSSDGSESTIIDCEGAGRAFSITAGLPVTISGLTIANGFAPSGGAFFIWDSAPVIQRNVIRGCRATRGGAIYCGTATIALIQDNVIEENDADYGGGLLCEDWSRSQVLANTIRGNSAVVEGGGIYDNGGAMLFEDNWIEGNTAARGGGYRGNSDGHLTDIRNNVFIENAASDGAGVVVSFVRAFTDNLVVFNYGIGIFVRDANLSLENNTIAYNTSHGVHISDDPPPFRFAMRNLIIAYNGGNAITCYRSPAEHSTIECSNIFGNASDGFQCVIGTNIMQLDPLFCRTEGDDAFFLKDDSPCAPTNALCGELVGARPVGCANPPRDELVECPPDTVVALEPGGGQAILFGFRVVNGGDVTTNIVYLVSSSGPAVLSDGGDPSSLFGITPPLTPGSSFTPPPARLVAPPDVAPFEQLVSYEAYANVTDRYDSCATVVSFIQPVPVAFTSIAAVPLGNGVELIWRLSEDTSAETRIYRSTNDATPELVGYVASSVNRFVDNAAPRETTLSYLVALLEDGVVLARSSSVTITLPPFQLAIHTLSPNPFTSTVHVAFELPRDELTILEVFDVRGGLVRRLVDDRLAAGAHDAVWDGRDGSNRSAANGVYFLRLTQGTQAVHAKALKLR